MNPIPVPDEAHKDFPDYKKIVVGSPTGKLDGDGSSLNEASALEALFGRSEEGPQFREYWKPNDEELKMLQDGGCIELIWWMPQMPVHAMNIREA